MASDTAGAAWRGAMPATLHAETRDLLIERMRAALYLVSLSIVTFGAIEIWLRRPTLPALLVVKTIQVATVVVVLLALRRRPSWAACVTLGLATVLEVCVTLAASGVLTREVASTPLLFIVLTLVTGASLPWGLWPQVATVLIATAALAWNVAAVPPPPQFGYSLVAALIAFVTSASVAHALERHRLARRVAEEDVRQSARELRYEMQVTGAVARVGREVVAALDAPAMLDRLCQLTAEALGCDASYTFLRDPADGAFIGVAAFGERPERLAWLRTRRIPEIALAPLAEQMRLGDAVAPVAASVTDVLPVEAGATLCAPLRRGHELVAILVAAFRSAAPRVPSEQRRMLSGIAQIGSLALAHVHFTAELNRASTEEAEFLARLAEELARSLAALREIGVGLDGASRESGARIGAIADALTETVLRTIDLRVTEATAVRVAPVPLARVLDDLGKDCAVLARRGGVTLRWRAMVGSRTVVTDAARLGAIVRTLVADGIARARGEAVEVGAADADGELMLRVVDPGAPLQSGEPERDGDERLHSRSWLGLHVVRRLALQLGGDVTVAPGEPTGSVVTLLLPLRRAVGADRAA